MQDPKIDYWAFFRHALLLVSVFVVWYLVVSYCMHCTTSLIVYIYTLYLCICMFLLSRQKKKHSFHLWSLLFPLVYVPNLIFFPIECIWRVYASQFC